MKHLLLCFCVVLFCASCSDSDILEDNFQNTIEFPEPNFFALTVGNSWVYKNYHLNQETGEYDDTGVIDSISIIGTEEHLGDTYFIVRRLTTGNESGISLCNENGEFFETRRESYGNLIDSTGFIKFASCDYNERLLHDCPWGTLHEITLWEKSTIEVEAGEFDCVLSNRYSKSPTGEQMKALDLFYYAEGIGLVYNTISFASSSTPTIIRRLDSYFIQ